MTSDGGGGGAVEGREQATIEEEPVLLPPVYEAPRVEAVHGCGARRRDLDRDAEMARRGGSGMEVGGEYAHEAESQKGAFDSFVVRETQDATVADGHGGDVEEVEVNVAQGDAVEANIDEGDVDNIADEGHAANIAEEGHETHDGNIADEGNDANIADAINCSFHDGC
ncbi:Os08g0340300 [Oryza sativa Japonica Group]|uniref:Os08g0340300 protein n=1 Tax=Oryza sativa subsp. japonica TaxID=39947 RepID=A0A0P0XES2_ORYSJ|nr:Os08g0340300 [Oryza sativa Japonica Group]